MGEKKKIEPCSPNKNFSLIKIFGTRKKKLNRISQTKNFHPVKIPWKNYKLRDPNKNFHPVKILVATSTNGHHVFEGSLQLVMPHFSSQSNYSRRGKPWKIMEWFFLWLFLSTITPSPSYFFLLYDKIFSLDDLVYPHFIDLKLWPF